jgi:hypothetical protein
MSLPRQVAAALAIWLTLVGLLAWRINSFNFVERVAWTGPAQTVWVKPLRSNPTLSTVTNATATPRLENSRSIAFDDPAARDTGGKRSRAQQNLGDDK